MGVTVQKNEDPARKVNTQLRTNPPNVLLDWRRFTKPKEVTSGNAHPKTTVQDRIRASASLMAFDRNKNAMKRSDKVTAKEEGNTKQTRRDKDKKKRYNDVALKKKDSSQVEESREEDVSTVSGLISDDSGDKEEKKIIEEEITQEEMEESSWDDTSALNPPEGPAPVEHEPERVKMVYNARCLQLGAVPSQRYMREVWRQRVVVCHQGLDPRHGKAIGLSLKDNRTVRELHLRDNKLGARGLLRLVDAFLWNTTLRLLDVSQNGLGTKGALLLAGLIAQNTSLESILAAGNSFGDKAGEFLGNALIRNSRLLELDLSCNLFEQAAGKSLGEGLVHNATLKLLDLSYNHFTRPGLLELLSALKFNKGLRGLSLAWSGIDSQLVTTLGKSLQDNSRLLALDLSGCRLDFNAVSQLLTYLRGNTSLKTLNVCDNPVPVSENIKLLTMLGSLAVENVYLTSIMMTSELQKAMNHLREVKPTFTLTYRINRTNDHVLMRRVVSGLVSARSDPLDIVLDHVHAKNQSISSLLSRCSSEDNPKVVQRQEFVRGLLEFGIILNVEQLNSLMTVFDPEANWQIEIDHVMSVCQQYRKKKEETRLGAMVRASKDTSFESDLIEQDLP